MTKKHDGAPTPGRENRHAPESDFELRELLDEVPVGLCFVSRDGHILWANQAELDLVGCEESECVGRGLGEFLMGPGVAETLLERLVSGERIEGQRARLRSKDGAIRQVLIDGSALFRDGEFIHGRTVTRDITALLEKEQLARHRLEETKGLNDQFLVRLSHELRSPLGTILLWLELLQQGGLDREESMRALGSMERAARALEHIIDDLRHAARIAAEGPTFIPQLVDLKSVIEVAVDAASEDAALEGLELTWFHGESPIWVKGDPGRLQQAVSNVLSNAVEFTPAGGKIEVHLDTLDRQARFRVIDSGEGMSSEFLPFAFDRFRQQDSTRTRAHQGLGLGLYVVRLVIEQHDGRVAATSAGPGRGTTITVLLPLASEHFAEGQPR